MQEQREQRVRPSAAVESYRRPRRGWQRRTKQSRETLRPRDTLRSGAPVPEPGDAPSPAEEILARHDAELREQQRTERDEGAGTSGVITF